MDTSVLAVGQVFRCLVYPGLSDDLCLMPLCPRLPHRPLLPLVALFPVVVHIRLDAPCCGPHGSPRVLRRRSCRHHSHETRLQRECRVCNNCVGSMGIRLVGQLADGDSPSPVAAAALLSSTPPPTTPESQMRVRSLAPLTRSPTHSITHSLTHSPTHSLTHSLIHSFTPHLRADTNRYQRDGRKRRGR